MSAAALVVAGLVAVLSGALLVLAERARARRLRDVAGPRHARLVPGGDRARLGAIVAFALGLALAFAAIKVAPADPRRADARGVDVVLCLDVSRSMLARDVAPDRLSRAKEEIRRLAERARGDRLALVVFAGEARLLVPLTTDLRSTADLADAADPSSVARGGTDLAAALAVAEAALAADAPAAVVLLTDGEDLAGRGERAAAALWARGVAVHTIGFGTALGGKVPLEDEGAPRFVRASGGGDVVSTLDAAGLSRLARAGGGTSVDGTLPGALTSLYETRIAPKARRSEDAPGAPRVAFQAALSAALLLFAVDLSASRRRRR